MMNYQNFVMTMAEPSKIKLSQDYKVGLHIRE